MLLFIFLIGFGIKLTKMLLQILLHFFLQVAYNEL